MITIIAKWTILPGNEKKAVTAINTLAAFVQKSEPGTLVYLPHTINMKGFNTPKPNPGAVIFYEVYKNQAALDKHISSNAYKQFLKDYSHLFECNSDGSPVISVESLISLKNGFVRSVIP